VDTRRIVTWPEADAVAARCLVHLVAGAQHAVEVADGGHRQIQALVKGRHHDLGHRHRIPFRIDLHGGIPLPRGPDDHRER
jgi:hypothetical protein